MKQGIKKNPNKGEAQRSKQYSDDMKDTYK